MLQNTWEIYWFQRDLNDVTITLKETNFVLITLLLTRTLESNFFFSFFFFLFRYSLTFCGTIILSSKFSQSVFYALIYNTRKKILIFNLYHFIMRMSIQLFFDINNELLSLLYWLIILIVFSVFFFFQFSKCLIWVLYWLKVKKKVYFRTLTSNSYFKIQAKFVLNQSLNRLKTQ